MTTGANKVLKLDSGRQEPINGEFDLLVADALLVASGVRTRFAWIPQGAILLNLRIVVETGFDSVTSDTLAIAWDDGTAILAATDIHTGATARVAASEANLGLQRTADDYLTLTWTGVGTAPTVGKVRVLFSYQIEGRALFNEGKDGVPPGLS